MCFEWCLLLVVQSMKMIHAYAVQGKGKKMNNKPAKASQLQSQKVPSKWQRKGGNASRAEPAKDTFDMKPFKGICHYCGLPSHMSSHCLKKYADSLK